MTKLDIEYLPIRVLQPYSRNARTHSKKQIKQIADSIRQFGFTNPLLIDKDNMILAGHGRLAAAGLLHLGTLPCVRLEHMTAAARPRLYSKLGRSLGSGHEFRFLKSNPCNFIGIKDRDAIDEYATNVARKEAAGFGHQVQTDPAQNHDKKYKDQPALRNAESQVPTAGKDGAEQNKSWIQWFFTCHFCRHGSQYHPPVKVTRPAPFVPPTC